MPFIKNNYGGVVMGECYLAKDESAKAANAAYLTTRGEFTTKKPKTALPFGLFKANCGENTSELTSVCCSGGLWETDVFEGKIQGGDLLGIKNGKICKAEKQEESIGQAINCDNSLLYFKLSI